ncbi:MAG: radical SAM protein [Myxococcales bacterium]|nr:radical SAM protein [Myxococcales bacterium]MCB9522276.1 radical SAM protein [Myxococcales bacterium]
MTDGLRIAGHAGRSRVNGPGVRAVLWVQGCSLACPGCFNPQTHAPDGAVTTVQAVVERLLVDREGLDGVTFSGGEPFEQAEALAAVARGLRAAWPAVHLMAYSGYAYEQLRGPAAPPGSAALLAALDMLVDGPFATKALGHGAWRASRNQRVWVLGRPPPTWAAPADAEITIGEEGQVLLSGLPDPGLRRAVDRLR